MTEQDLIDAFVIDEDDKRNLRGVALRSINQLISEEYTPEGAIEFVGNIISAVRDTYGD